MKHRESLLLAVLIIGLFSCVVLPSVNAEVFDIGTKVSESDQDLRDRKMVYFDSGNSVYIEPDYIDYITPILDGNIGTGIDHDFGPGHSSMFFEVVFPYSINVSNITIKPNFGGGTTNYTLYLNSNGIWSPWFTQKNSTEETFQINSLISGVWLDLDTDGTNHYYFNDIIINYTPGFDNLSVIQDQFNNLSQQIDILNNEITSLNNLINELNLTQSEIIENVTNLLDTYNQLNTSLVNLNNEFANLDSHIFNLEYKNLLYEQEIDNLTSEISNLTFDLENFENRIILLESENTELKSDIILLINENTVIYNKLDNLTKEIENLKDTKEELDNTIAFGALIIGILGTLIALVAIIIASRKQGGQKLQTEKKEVEEGISSEEDERKVSGEDSDS